MPPKDNYLKILEKMGEIGKDVGVLGNEIQHVKASQAETKQELLNIKEQDIHQNKLLDKHILGVNTAMSRLENEIEARKADKILIQKQIDEIDARLKDTEFLPKFFISLRKIAKWLAGFAIAALAISKFFRWF